MSNALTCALEGMSGFAEIKDTISRRGAVLVTGCLDTQKANLAGALAEKDRSVVIICENELKARGMFEDIVLYEPDALLYPARDMVFYRSALRADPISRERLKTLRALCEQKRVVAVTPAGGVLDRLLPFSVFKNEIISLSVGDECDFKELSKSFADCGYERCAEVNSPGDFSIRGGIVDIFDMTRDYPVRIEFWGDEIDSIRSFDPESQRSVEELESVSIYPATEEIGAGGAGFYKRLTASFADYLPKDTLFVLDDPARIAENAKALLSEFYNAIEGRLSAGQAQEGEIDRMLPADAMFAKLTGHAVAAMSALGELGDCPVRFLKTVQLSAKPAISYNNRYDMLIKDLKAWKLDRRRVVLVCASRTRGRRLANDLLGENLNAFFSEDANRSLEPSEVMVLYGTARHGFEYPDEKFVLITESDMFGQKRRHKKKEKRYDGKSIAGFSQLSVGDYVVHEFHGLGIYRGIEKISRDGTDKDYIKIEYAAGDVLYVQASQISTLQKYGSSKSHSTLKLHSLSGTDWKKTKSRVRGAVKDIAEELVKLYSIRQNANGYVYGPDTVWQSEFEEMFPFEETADQLTAVEEIKKDMESPGIMDRILCGDVGYGKTEVAIRAAFKAVQESKQVVVLVPTTILAQQHYLTFTERMKDFPVRIDLLCRFRTQSQQKKTIENLKKGAVDIVIGTHRVLSKDVGYKDLGLLIVDEEQRFGVTHKEMIKQLKSKVDVLTLTATPIPRTLHMGLIGIRDMSVLEEAPLNRHPIQTYVMEFDDEIVREAISRELARGGQTYYVFNRVAGIEEMAYKISSMIPEANVAYAHGQMPERDLERVMYRFIDGEIDVLVSTTIIETGMDISNVNTMIVHDADRFGLAQLYQLRGRIGRSDRTAYAFFMYRRDKLLREEAERRLASIREFTELGSGIKIAMRDLEIRGAGNLLGARQSGHMDDVGYDLYCKLLTEAVSEAKGEKQEASFETVIDIDVSAYIPEEYIVNESQRLEIYKKIGIIESANDRDEMLGELIDRFGEPATCVLNLLDVSLLKARAHSLYLTEVKQLPGELKLSFYENAEIRTEGIGPLMEKLSPRLRLYTKKDVYFVYEFDAKKGNVLEELKLLIDDFEAYLKG